MLMIGINCATYSAFTIDIIMFVVWINYAAN